MNSKNKKLRVGSAMLIVFSNIVGAGVFFKTSSMGALCNYNPYSIILAWVIGFVIALTTALAFVEITSIKGCQGGGMASWVKRILGSGMGRLAYFFVSIMYFLGIGFILAVFCSESILKFFDYVIDTKDASQNPDNSWMDRHLYVAVLVALFIFISFILFNTFTNKGTLIGKYGAFVKFIPLFTVISVGIIGAIVSRDAGFFDKDTSDLSHPVGPFNFGLILTALPAVLFSFDGFTSAGNVSDRMENPEKEVSKTIIYSMILVGVIYILMCLGFLLSGDTDIFSFFETIFPSGENVKKILGVIISIILFMCLAISTNGFILAGVNSLKYAVNYDEIVGTTTIKRICKNNEQKTLLCYLFFVILGCLLFMGVPAILLKSDAIFDIISNTLAQIMFVLYALLAGRCWINKYDNKFEPTIRVKGYAVFALLSMIGCFGSTLYSLIYSFTIVPILDPNAAAGYGLFMNGNSSTIHSTNLTSCLVYWTSFVIVLGLCGLNFIKPKAKVVAA